MTDFIIKKILKRYNSLNNILLIIITIKKFKSNRKFTVYKNNDNIYTDTKINSTSFSIDYIKKIFFCPTQFLQFTIQVKF